MAQQITPPEPSSDLRNDEDNFAVKSNIIYAAYAETLDLNPKRGTQFRPLPDLHSVRLHRPYFYNSRLAPSSSCASIDS